MGIQPDLPLVILMCPLTNTVRSPAVVLATYMIDLGLFVRPGDGLWPLYTDFLPDAPGVEDSAAALYDSPGEMQGKAMSGQEYQRYGVRIDVRGRTDPEAWEKLTSVTSTMAMVANRLVLVEGKTYFLSGMQRLSGVLDKGMDSKRRSTLSVLFYLTLWQQ